MPLCTLGGETVLPLMACKMCEKTIFGWITYHEEWIENRCDSYVAYCYECTHHDKVEKGEPWTLRVRCAYWADQSDPSSRCKNCWQSCRIQGGATSHCLRYWGRGKSVGKPNWYCKQHVKTMLGDQKPPDPYCECPKRWPWKDTPNVPHHVAAQQDAEWVKDSGLLALEDDHAAALVAQWVKSPAGG